MPLTRLLLGVALLLAPGVTRAESPNGTHLFAPTDAPIVSATGNKWGINAAGQVTVDGAADKTTQGVTHLHYDTGRVLQRNSWGNWYAKKAPKDAWAAASAPPGDPTESAEGARITRPTDPAIVTPDLASWTLGSDGRVYVNGKADTTTSSVALLQYHSHRVYQRNAWSNWWYRAGIADTWHATPDPNIGPVGPGTWAQQSLGGMTYFYLPPAGTEIGYRYPVLLFLHQPGGALTVPAELEPWVNTVAFRSRYQVITLAPRCDAAWGGQTAAATDCEKKALAIVKDVVAKYGDPTRVYVTGIASGGTWDAMIRYNSRNGREDRVFTAGVSLAGSVSAWGAPNSDVVAQFAAGVPMYAVHGANDTQVSPAWDRAMAKALAGKSTFIYKEIAGAGTNVWDASYPMPNGQAIWDWATKLAFNPVPIQPGPTASPDGTTLLPGSNATITDATGAIWRLDSSRRVLRNGAVVYSIATARLVYSGGKVWRQAPTGLWWYVTPPATTWQPILGTRTGPTR